MAYLDHLSFLCSLLQRFVRADLLVVRLGLILISFSIPATIVQPMGFWLKSFNAPKNSAPVPGRSYTISQINLLPLPATVRRVRFFFSFLSSLLIISSVFPQAIFVVVGYLCAWTSDGPLKGRRWPLIFVGSFASELSVPFVRRSRSAFSKLTSFLHRHRLQRCYPQNTSLHRHQDASCPLLPHSLCGESTLSFIFVLESLSPSFLIFLSLLLRNSPDRLRSSHVSL